MTIGEMIPVSEVDAYIRRELLKDVDRYRHVGPVMLTQKESILLGLLMVGRIVTPLGFALAANRPAENEGHDDLLKVYVHRLRRKLTTLGVTIETLWGEGVRMTPLARGIVTGHCRQEVVVTS